MKIRFAGRPVLLFPACPARERGSSPFQGMLASGRRETGRCATKTGIAATLWLLLAITIGKMPWLAAVPAPMIQGMHSGLTALLPLLVLYWRSAGILHWAVKLDLRFLVLFPATRFVGIYSPYLYSQGRLRYAFAVPGGWGDIAVAAIALGVAACPAPRIVYLWNIAGFADIRFVVATAARLGLHDPASISALTGAAAESPPYFSGAADQLYACGDF